MRLEHVELLRLQRDLYDLPRNMERFNQYLRLISDGQGGIRYPPLIAINPMAREHLNERLDEVLGMGAESIAAEALRYAEPYFSSFDGDFQHGLAMADDVRGGWTNRYTSEASLRFSLKPGTTRGWLVTILWVSETPSATRIREEVLGSVYRMVHIQQYGTPKTLRQMMEQEGKAALFAEMTPHLDEEDLDYSRYVLEPHLDTTSYPVIIAALYGDTAARMLGYEPLGLSERAGFAVALADQKSQV